MLEENTMKITKIIVSLTLLTSILGCATIRTQMTSHENFSESDQMYTQSRSDCILTNPHVYSGTVDAFEMIFYPSMCPCGSLAFLGFYPFFLPFLIIDLPLSAAADTIILPYTTYRQIKFGNIESGCPY